MTREEARDECIKIAAFAISEKQEKAMLMAAKALEQEPCGDLISRKKVLNQIFYSTDNSGDVVLGSALRHRIENLPPVKQEPKVGHWRPVYQGDEIINYRCSECEFGNTFGKSTYGMNYCPNCGCRMVEPQERSDKE